MKILAKTFHFDKGVLYVILLPEEPSQEELCSMECIKGGQCDGICNFNNGAYERACAYARAHPVSVQEKDVQEIKWHMWNSRTDNKIIPFANWQPQDLTEYNIEGVRMEIKEVKKPLTWNDFGGVDKYELIQIARLMADDKQ